ncbi:MAG: translation initiation factor IF-3 [Candidatus Nealsonbacteria bacterium RIFOXYB1_FULL_40_15]|uniref:Translation initiation factor IF-3 n=2 Tax=Candidatus Nealsoniibacteriota TaxID=1817911 RepID=A0A1G2ETE5_9BACT|nr:MAG: translation initiation factor IF-3 [Candidatus Nealsonbacteria bacterium RIFOXYB1_FULL_40_15]OGZ28478.1 MAG: translation initiation factor IF-3 [Candidatus Nealsonbacteria bacterium RIFOXYD1_FULL_39_11]OGZ29089.1 MAG: translation initiation factor IF-3 [Candidatus Nealsonbacteria bacterium RIFOXYC1_FULL_40_7]
MQQTKIKIPFSNNRIRAKEVRLIDETGNQIGVISLEEALAKAKEKGLDLVQITEKVEPPVCKITDLGKYLYSLKKKERQQKHHHIGELKGIRLTFAISDHDIEVRSNQAMKFLLKGDKVLVEMRLRGREKAHQDMAREKMQRFASKIGQLLPIKIERELKKEPRGFTMIISKK